MCTTFLSLIFSGSLCLSVDLNFLLVKWRDGFSRNSPTGGSLQEGPATSSAPQGVLWRHCASTPLGICLRRRLFLSDFTWGLDAPCLRLRERRLAAAVARPCGCSNRSSQKAVFFCEMDLRDLKGWASAVAQKGQQLARSGIEFVGRRTELANAARVEQSCAFSQAPLPPNFVQYCLQLSDQRSIPPLAQQRGGAFFDGSCSAGEGSSSHSEAFVSRSWAASEFSEVCCLELPFGLEPTALTVEALRALLDLPAVFHLRFKVRCLYTSEEAVWVDEPPPSASVPLFDGRVLFKALLLPLSEKQWKTHREALYAKAHCLGTPPSGVDATALLATLQAASSSEKPKVLSPQTKASPEAEDAGFGAPPRETSEQQEPPSPSAPPSPSQDSPDDAAVQDLLNFGVENAPSLWREEQPRLAREGASSPGKPLARLS